MKTVLAIAAVAVLSACASSSIEMMKVEKKPPNMRA